MDAWRRRGWRHAWIAFGLGLGLCAFAGAAVLGLEDGIAQGLPLGDGIGVLSASQSMADSAAILAGLRDREFEPPGDAVLRCTGGRVCWVRIVLSIRAGAASAWWLRLRAVRPGSTQLHAANNAGGEAAPQPGREFPLNWRFVGTDLFFPLALSASPTTYYLRVSDTPGVDGLQVLQQAGFDRQQRQLGLYLGISAGAAFALMVLNLVFWRWLRDRLFLNFALLMLMAVVLHAWQLVPSMWQPERLGDLNLRGLLQSLMQAASILFVSRLFDFQRHLPLAARAAAVFAVLNLAVGAIAAAGHYARIETAVAVLDLTGMITAAAAAAWLMLVRRQWQFAGPAALMLFLAFTSGLGRLRWLGLLDIGPDEGLGPTWATARLIYMLLLAVIVADRTRRAEVQLQQARRQSLEDAQRAERELEGKVRQRTLDLHRSNAQLASEIERRRQAEAELAAALLSERNALAQQRQFVSLVSHEFRTPLAVIDAAAQSIGLAGVETPPRLAKIRRAVQRLSLLVVNCLAEDRLHAGRSPMRQEPVDLRKLAEGVVAHFGPFERTRIRLQLPGESVHVQGDAALLDIALHNVVQNAIKYSRAVVDIRVQIDSQADEAHVEIEDRGDGIPADEHARIFERFFRGRGVGGASGTGLGLFLGADIARAHDGSLALVRSDARGSLFRFCLSSRTQVGAVPR